MTKSTKYTSFSSGCYPEVLDIEDIIISNNDSITVVLNNSDLIKFKPSEYDQIKHLSIDELKWYEISNDRHSISWFKNNIHIAEFLNDAAKNDTIQRLNALCHDVRPNTEKIVMMVVYINCYGRSAQRKEEMVLEFRNSFEHIKEHYDALVKSFQMFFVPVEERETEIQLFLI